MWIYVGFVEIVNTHKINKSHIEKHEEP